MSLLYIACLIIIGGCTIAVIWSSIDCMYWTNKKIKLLREIQRSIEREQEGEHEQTHQKEEAQAMD